MEFRALKYFQAVAAAGSVTAGAAAIRVSQPAVSRQIRGLEKELGVALFTRDEAGVVLSRAGEQLLVLAEDLMQREKYFKDAAASLAAGRLATLTIAAPTTTLTDIVAPYLAQRSEEGPAPNVVVRPADEVYEALDGEADVAISVAAPPSGLESTLIAELPVRAYDGRSEGGRGVREASLTLEEIASADPLITLPEHYAVRQLLNQTFAHAALAPRRVQEVDSPEAAQAIAASGRGLAVLTNDPRFGLVPQRIVDADGVVLTLPLFAAWRRDHHGAAALAEVAQDLREFCIRQYAAELD